MSTEESLYNLDVIEGRWGRKIKKDKTRNGRIFWQLFDKHGKSLAFNFDLEQLIVDYRQSFLKEFKRIKKGYLPGVFIRRDKNGIEIYA